MGGGAGSFISVCRRGGPPTPVRRVHDTCFQRGSTQQHIELPSTNISHACAAYAYFCFPVDSCCPVIYLMQEKYIVNHCVQIMTLLSLLMLIRKRSMSCFNVIYPLFLL